jgi:sulfur-carrier protein
VDAPRHDATQPRVPAPRAHAQAATCRHLTHDDAARARQRDTAPAAEFARYDRRVAVLKLFASAREAAGTSSDVIDGATVGDVLDHATARFGPRFAQVLTTCRIWVNGESADRVAVVGPHDEVAVLPPVSGGCT